jgi:hypothetical protein
MSKFGCRVRYPNVRWLTHASRRYHPRGVRDHLAVEVRDEHEQPAVRAKVSFDIERP